ncbi:sporulation peptidase YabG [Natronospora cellulosivora (SeqCode)]
MDFSIGDYVSRKSYNSDIIFRIENIKNNSAYLRSFKLRLMADAPLDDLVKIKNEDKKNLKRELVMDSYQCLQRQQKHIILNSNFVRSNKNQNSYREYPVKVLHLDGDKSYLDLSLENYRNLSIDVQGFFIPEKGQPERVRELIKKYRPDILVITGHDGELNDKKFHTSDFFLRAVEIARQIESDLDRLVIFAGACQSDYERLIAGGANFASSPENKLIHFLDPILVVEKIAFTPINEVISVKDIINNTITGQGGVGGIETRGKLRLQYP